jgi:hypothetical protein
LPTETIGSQAAERRWRAIALSECNCVLLVRCWFEVFLARRSGGQFCGAGPMCLHGEDWQEEGVRIGLRD